jgi:hypothetical protein
MEKNIPLIKLTIDPTDENTGVELVSLVDRPAIERQWMAFSTQIELVKPEAGEDKDTYLGRCIPAMIREGMEQDQAAAVCYTTWERERMRARFAVQSEEKRIVSGPLMMAGLPIYRRDDDGREYYVQFDADTVRAIVYKYFKNGRNTKANLQHTPKIADGVFLFESWITDETKPAPKGFDALPDGSWFGSFKVDNDEVWAKVKDGTFTGFSVEGVFIDAEQQNIDRLIVEEVVRILSQS